MHLSTNELKDSKITLHLEELMESEKLLVRENRINKDNVEILLESLNIQQRRLSITDHEKKSIKNNEKKTLVDERSLGILNSHSKDFASNDGLQIKQKTLDKKGSKQVKAKTCSEQEKESNVKSCVKVVGIKSVELLSLDDLQEMESDRKVQESLDTFICQTMAREPYMSFSSRPNDKPLQKIIEHQQALDTCVKSLKVDVDILDNLGNNANLEPHQTYIEKNLSNAKGRGSHADHNLQTIKSNIPITMATLTAVAAKTLDLPNWPLLSPSKVQLQKCEKCFCNFFSPLNHRRHIRMHHRRISNVDKEDLILKKKNIAAFWDKLNYNQMQQIFEESRKYDLEDLSGEAIITNLIAFKKQNNQMTLPPTYVKAGQDLLDALDKKQSIFPLTSKQILSILDEASEKTFLCSQGDMSKIGFEEKNLVASLGYIVEQTLVKAWMVDKDAEALRNQQELFKEEEAAQMKRVRSVAKKKKKKEKFKQKGLKEAKVGTIQSIVNGENESIDGENLLLEVVEEDNSPTASSTSINSSGLENQLLEPLDMEVNNLFHNVDWNSCSISREDGHLQKSKDVFIVHMTSKEIASDQMNQCGSDLNNKEKGQYSKSLFLNENKVEEQRNFVHILEQDQSVIEPRKRIPWRPYKEPLQFDYQDSYQRSGWVSNPRFQEGMQQNYYKMLQKSSIGTPYISNIERGNSPILGFYRSRTATLKGIVPFPISQQWTRKTQMPTSFHYVKDGEEDGSCQEHDTIKSNMNDVTTEQTTFAPEINVNSIGSFDTTKKELELPAKIPLAKVVASSGGLNNMPLASFNLNANSEDWPPLSNLHTTYYPKNNEKHSLTSNHCELNLRPQNKFDFNRRDGSQNELESKIERSIPLTIPLAKGLIDYNTSKSLSIGCQEGILIGSVSVPLDDYAYQSKHEMESTRKNVCIPLQTNPSCTSILTASTIQYTQDPTTNAIGHQNAHEEIKYEEFEVSNMQVTHSYGGPCHYRTLGLKSTSNMNFNGRLMRRPTFDRTYIYPLGDQGEQGILSKQPSWSNGPLRQIPQKVWRPVRSIVENVDPCLDGKIDVEENPINNNDNESNKPLNIEGSINVSSFQSKGVQVWDRNVDMAEQFSISTTNTKTQLRNKDDVFDLKTSKENALLSSPHISKSMILDTQHLQCQKESNKVAFVARKIDNINTFQSVKYNAIEQTHVFQNTNDEISSIYEKAHIKTTLSHSTWIAEVLEFHLSRWYSAMKDPDTIISKCEEEHFQQQTSIWVDFLAHQPFIATNLVFKKEETFDQELDSKNHVVVKNSKNLPNEQTLTNTPNCIRHEGSRSNSKAIVSGEKLQKNLILACESRSPSSVDFIAIGLQNHEINEKKGQVESRSSSSCSDGS